MHELIKPLKLLVLPFAKDWHDLSHNGPMRSFSPNAVVPSPFKPGPPSPLRVLMDDPKAVKVDLAHTWAIAGVGKDDAASCIVFLAVRCEVFGPGGFETQLHQAWVSFKSWCVRNGKSTSIQDFAKEDLKITSCLDIFLIEFFVYPLRVFPEIMIWK